MSYTVKDVSGAPLVIDSNTTSSNAVLPKFSLSDPTGGNVSQANPLWTQIPDCPASPAANASALAVLFSVDTSTYQSIAVQITVPGTTNTISFEGSNDNINWTPVTGYVSSNIGSATPFSSVTSPTAGSIFFFPTYAQYFRARVSTYTSGTVTAVYRLRDTPLGNIAGYVGGGTVGISNTPSVYVKPTATGGLSQFRFLTATPAVSNVIMIKASAGQIFAYSFYNASTTIRYVHIYNIATTPTMGTTADTRVIAIGPGLATHYSNDIGISFSNGIAIAVTTAPGSTDNTVANIGANDIVGMVDYI